MLPTSQQLSTGLGCRPDRTRYRFVEQIDNDHLLLETPKIESTKNLYVKRSEFLKVTGHEVMYILGLGSSGPFLVGFQRKLCQKQTRNVTCKANFYSLEKIKNP